MRLTLLAVLLAVAAGCGAPKTREEQMQDVFAKESAPSGPSSAGDVEQLEAWSGKNITLVGRFDHLNFKHGVLILASGLKVYLPHFDLFMEGEDWFKYVGQKVWCRGILHTYTKNIEGYRGPSLELNDFSGP
ncbi:MAG: hypothetical protein JO332_17185 [Planctomycetaceae bacterium]|nr:hypothetical protein [Planctomycetaceae bacterium]